MLNRLGAALLVAGDTPGLATFVVELNLIVEHYNRLCRHVRKDIGASGRLMVDPIAVQPYTGRPVTVIPRVYYCDEDKPAVELALGADFSVTYRNNTNDGSAQVIIHGRGAYKGRQAVSFNIVNNEQ
jgi:hypothetical protein